MSEEAKMFCNICGKEIAIEKMMEVAINISPWTQSYIRTCIECGEKKMDEEQEALRIERLKNYRPYTQLEAQDELVGMQLQTAHNKRCLVTAIDGDKVLAGDKWVTLAELLFEYWIGYDHPCGKVVQK